MQKPLQTMRLALAIFVIIILQAEAQQPASAPKQTIIRKISLEGLVRANKIVQFKIKNTVGSPYSPQTNQDDIDRLMATNQFENVTISVQPLNDGIELIYRFQEKPEIKKISITGNKHIKSKKILKKITLKKGDLFDAVRLNRELEDVKEMYRDKNYKNVRCFVESDLDPQTNSVEIEIKVVEGAKPKIKRINITGNKSIKKSKIKKAMLTKERGVFSWLSGSGIYEEDLLDLDRENIVALYMAEGFLDVKVTTPRPVFSKDKRIVTLNIDIIEGPRYYVGRVQITGNTIFETEELEKACGLKTGDIFRKGYDMTRNSIEMSEFLIRNKYATKGYIEAAVNSVALPGDQANVFDVTFNIVENNQIRVRKIDITGNYITKDKVIRRELAVNPGNIYDTNRVRASISRLRNLGYFKTVDIYSRPSPVQDQRDLVVKVEEGETVRLGAGMAFSSIDKLVGSFEVSFSNFDLFNWGDFRGGGQKFRILTKFGTKRTDYELNFTEPWFLNRRLSAGFDIYRHDLRFLSSEYDQQTTGFDIRFSKMLMKRIRGKLTYKYESIEINAEEDAPAFILEEEGKDRVSSVKFDLIRDTRNNILFPTKGMRSSASFELGGGLLGADRDFLRQNYRHVMYLPIVFDTIMRLRGWLGFIAPYGDTEDIPIYERFFLGGRTTVRGYQYRKVGPKDETGSPIGGESLILLSAEYIIPLHENINWAFFYDTGNIYEDDFDIDLADMRSGAGIGIRFLIPSLRIPVSLDYAWPLDPDEFDDDKPRFEFSIGTTY